MTEQGPYESKRRKRSPGVEPIVPTLSSSTVGPLGLCHLPRLWLKTLLYATGRLPYGYRHGTGGTDEFLFKGIGLNGRAFARFIETELPTYVRCEQWVRENAGNLNERSIAAVNDGVLHHRKPDSPVERGLLATKLHYIGIDDSDIVDPVLLNDLDDWTTIHAQLAEGSVPPVRISCLNAVFAEILQDVFDRLDPSRVTIRVDLPSFGLEPLAPRGEVNREGLAPMIARDPFGKALSAVTEQPDTDAAIEFIRRERRTLVQDDVSNPNPDTGKPRTLIDHFGVSARLMSPIFVGDDLVAWISVYDGPRHWTREDVGVLDAAAAEARTMIETAMRESASAAPIAAVAVVAE